MLNPDLKDLKTLSEALSGNYANADPFPHIVIDNFFDQDILKLVTNEFKTGALSGAVGFNDAVGKKFITGRGGKVNGTSFPHASRLLSYLNSSEFVDFLQVLTGIQEPLIPDPHFIGGGLHEGLRGGFLKMHTDYSIHPETRLDRRINLLAYLNQDWEREYGGFLELWDSELKRCHHKILPIFNRVVIFSTTDYSFHGNPDPVLCPSEQSRKSIAVYYFSNGRPSHEIRPSTKDESTIYVQRPGENWAKRHNIYRFMLYIKTGLIKDIVPPLLFRFMKRAMTNSGK